MVDGVDGGEEALGEIASADDDALAVGEFVQAEAPALRDVELFDLEVLAVDRGRVGPARFGEGRLDRYAGVRVHRPVRVARKGFDHRLDVGLDDARPAVVLLPLLAGPV